MTNKKPLVSIVIPCYNHADFVQESIQSIIDQDYENIELIIIDDGSKDNSVDVIQGILSACRKRFIRFEFRHRPNKGLCATLNEALEWCKGEYFAPLASDDVALPYKTREQIDYFIKNKDNTVAGVFGRVSILYDGNMNESFNINFSGRIDVFNFKDIFLRKSKVPAPTAMLKLSKLKSCGGYDENIKVEDFYMWLKLTSNGDKLAFIDKVLTYYRRHPGNLSQKSDVMISGVEEVLSEYIDNVDYTEALARSYLVHAGDIVENKATGSFRYVLSGLKLYPQLIFSKVFLAYFYRMLLGLKHNN